MKDSVFQVKVEIFKIGSEDGYIRLWPLDFSDYFIELNYNNKISCLCLSRDSLYLSICTSYGNLSIFQIANQRNNSLIRCHSDSV